MNPVTGVFLVDQDRYRREVLSRSYRPLRWRPRWLRLANRSHTVPALRTHAGLK